MRLVILPIAGMALLGAGCSTETSTSLRSADPPPTEDQIIYQNRESQMLDQKEINQRRQEIDANIIGRMGKS